MKIKVGDYFTSQDMVRHGPDAWQQVRDKIRGQGYRVGSGYGNFKGIIEPIENIVLYPDGDLVHSRDTPKMLRLVTIKDFIGVKMKKIKIRCTDARSRSLAFQYLTELGYCSDYKNQIIDREHSVGLIGDENGRVSVITTESTFSNVYCNVDEVQYAIEVTYKMTNVTIVEPLVEVLGYSVNEAALTEWLKSNATKSAN